jgi:N-acetylmuramoyl-L-alanine amidase
MGNDGIIVCGKRYAVDHKVVTFEDERGYSGYLTHCSNDISKIHATHPARGLENRVTRWRTRRLLYGSTRLSRLRKVVRQIVIHLDGCRDARMCYDVLHNQRGLSVHFIIDNDGTIYQTLDLLHGGFHAGGVNEISVGIELCNRGDAAKSPKYYKEDRPTVTCRVHNVQFLCYDFTPAQYEATFHLCRTLTRVFDVPTRVPLDAGGDHLWTKIGNIRAYRGFVGHYHLSTNKWDPGPFDFQRVFRAMGSQVTFPFTAPPSWRELGSEEVQKKRNQKLAARYYENSEQDVQVHFPLGPLGHSRLWHGGVHLKATFRAPVHAVLRGRLVVARVGPSCPVGSCNFALIKHEMVVGRSSWTFFSLYYHLAWDHEQPDASAKGIKWLEKALIKQRDNVSSAQTLLLNESVEAGDLIGRVGEAGPTNYRDPQLHFAVISAVEMGSKISADRWTVYDEGGSGRLCKDARILRRIDRPRGGKPPDGLISRRELRNFFRFSDKRQELRRMVVRHRSEWTEGNWEKELLSAPDFAALPVSRRKRLIRQQIEPTLWWTESVAQHAGLPKDGMIYSYHPIGFLGWFADVARRTKTMRAKGIEGADRWEGKMAPAHLTVDAESGDHMTDSEDYYSGESGRKLTLEDLVNGYPEQKK